MKNKYLEERLNEEEWKKEIVTPRIAVSSCIESSDRKSVIVIKRKFPPHGYAFPGGMMDLGENVYECAIRETKEETTLDVKPIGLLTLSSEPNIDPRWHVVINYVVCKVESNNEPEGTDDALEAFWMDYLSDELSNEFTQSFHMALDMYRLWRKGGWPLIQTLDK